MVTENITGASLSGNDGESNRTYVLANANADTTTLKIYVGGLFLHLNVDYTVAGITVTFLNYIYDSSAITVDYSLTGTVSVASSYYGAGTTELINFLGITTTMQSDMNITDTVLLQTLERAQAEIDERTKTHFANGDDTTPDYIAITNEKHDGKGKFNRDYFTTKYPLPDVTATADGDVAIGAATITVDSTTGFLASGIIGVGLNKITYTGKTATTFTGCSGIVEAISDGDTIRPFVFEISVDDSGTVPTFQVMDIDEEFDCKLDSGKFHLFKNYVISSIYTTNNPPSMTPNRVRISYIYGWDTIPADITRLTLMIASRDLQHMIVRKATLNGLNSFSPNLLSIDDELIEQTILRYQNPLFGNT